MRPKGTSADAPTVRQASAVVFAVLLAVPAAITSWTSRKKGCRTKESTTEHERKIAGPGISLCVHACPFNREKLLHRGVSYSAGTN